MSEAVTMTISTVEKVLFLKGVDLFSALAGEDLAEVALVTGEVGREAGDVLVAEGEPGDALYFIVAGQVAVKRGGRLLAELGARDVFGEMALLDPGPRSATVEAKTDVTLLVLQRDDLDDLMRERPEVPIGILKVVVGRLRRAIENGRG
jgi:CRP/FNR family cyclic AMP-dependent transcriptional regulator